jgi:alpha-tubulin suppressor-like RCC1 family protein
LKSKCVPKELFAPAERVRADDGSFAFDQFVQVSCGYRHTLLLNKHGEVYSFGQGIFG